MPGTEPLVGSQEPSSSALVPPSLNKDVLVSQDRSTDTRFRPPPINARRIPPVTDWVVEFGAVLASVQASGRAVHNAEGRLRPSASGTRQVIGHVSNVPASPLARRVEMG